MWMMMMIFNKENLLQKIHVTLEHGKEQVLLDMLNNVQGINVNIQIVFVQYIIKNT